MVVPDISITYLCRLFLPGCDGTFAGYHTIFHLLTVWLRSDDNEMGRGDPCIAGGGDRGIETQVYYIFIMINFDLSDKISINKCMKMLEDTG